MRPLIPVFAVLQVHLLAVPGSGQQRAGLRLRPLLPAHPGHAGNQPVLHLLLRRRGRSLRRGASTDGPSSLRTSILRLKGRRRSGDEDWEPEMSATAVAKPAVNQTNHFL